MRAEKLAWKLSKEMNINLAVMNPCLIWGEMLGSSLNTSSGAILSYLNGSRTLIQNCTKCVVAVEDVALAHVLAYEKGLTHPEIIYGKRYLLVGACPAWSEISNVLQEWSKKNNLTLPIPTEVDSTLPPSGLGADPPAVTPYNVSRANELLGLQFRSMKQMVNDTADSLLRHGYVKESKEE